MESNSEKPKTITVTPTLKVISGLPLSSLNGLGIGCSTELSYLAYYPGAKRLVILLDDLYLPNQSEPFKSLIGDALSAFFAENGQDAPLGLSFENVTPGPGFERTIDEVIGGEFYSSVYEFKLTNKTVSFVMDSGSVLGRPLPHEKEPGHVDGLLTFSAEKATLFFQRRLVILPDKVYEQHPEYFARENNPGWDENIFRFYFPNNKKVR